MVTFDYATQPKVRVHSCNLCGGRRFQPVADEDRYGLPVHTDKCKSCGLIFINPRMTREAYAEFYRNGTYRKLLEDHKGGAMSTGEFEAWQNRYIGKLFFHLKPFRRHLNQSKTLLDIGGSGGLAAAALGSGFELAPTVMEPSDEERWRAEARGIETIPSMIEDYEPNGRRFDLIMLCQTVDHLLDIMGSLRTIRALLEDDGLFFVDAVWTTPVKVDHPFYLDEYTMPEYLRRAGFRVLREYKGKRRVRLNYVCGRA